MSPMENWNADEPPAVDPDYVEEPTEEEPELADVVEIASDEVPKLLDEADEIGAMRPRMRKSVTPAKKGAKAPAADKEDDLFSEAEEPEAAPVTRKESLFLETSYTTELNFAVLDCLIGHQPSVKW